MKGSLATHRDTVTGDQHRSESRGDAWRIALYSHDTMGIGHVRRNLLIAHAMTGSPLGATVLIIAGVREASMFAAPPGTDYLTLPSLWKNPDGQYGSRQLGIPLPELIQLRSETILTVMQSFSPDLLVVDKVPRGVAGELDPALQLMRERGDARCVLGLRDVLDDASTVRREWEGAGCDDVIRDHYDAIWVYGDRAICDPVVEYDLSPHVADKVRFTGYLDPRVRMQSADGMGHDPLRALPASSRLVLGLVGGGQDGAAVAEAFMSMQIPADMHAVLLTGPYMPDAVCQRLCQLARDRRQFSLMGFVPDADWLMNRAEKIITMGGYNTICELLSLEKPALIVPRIHPRQEQWLRAKRLENLGLIDVLHPCELSPAALAAWVASDASPRTSPIDQIDFGGLSRLPVLIKEVLARPG